MRPHRLWKLRNIQPDVGWSSARSPSKIIFFRYGFAGRRNPATGLPWSTGPAYWSSRTGALMNNFRIGFKKNKDKTFICRRPWECSFFDALCTWKKRGQYGSTGSGVEWSGSCEWAITHCLDVTVLDISMTTMGDLEAVEQISEKCPNTRVLIVSMHSISYHCSVLYK